MLYLYSRSSTFKNTESMTKQKFMIIQMQNEIQLQVCDGMISRHFLKLPNAISVLIFKLVLYIMCNKIKSSITFSCSHLNHGKCSKSQSVNGSDKAHLSNKANLRSKMAYTCLVTRWRHASPFD